MGCLRLEILEKYTSLRMLNGGNLPISKRDVRSYRYGFNGMEKDGELSGEGNSYTTQFRQYDPRIGRWKSIDPLMFEFPWMSPYVAFNDNPVYFIDPLGLKGTHGGKRTGGWIGHGFKKHGGKHHDKKGSIESSIDPNSDGTAGYEWTVKIHRTFRQKLKNSFKKVAQFFHEVGEKIGEFLNHAVNDDRNYIPELELNTNTATLGVSIGGFGTSAGLGWEYLRVDGTDGFWEEGRSIISHDFGFGHSPSSGDVNVPKSIKEGFDAEILSIGGGTLTIDKDYWRSHPTRSLTQLLSGKIFETYQFSFGYKYTHISIVTKDRILIGTMNLHSFALSKPGFSVSESSEKVFELSFPMNYDDSIKTAKDANTPSFNDFLNKKK